MRVEDDLMAPASIEDEDMGREADESVEEREAVSGQPSSYTGPEARCQFCLHFREFSAPACRKFKFDADPEGYCEEFEGRKEDSYGTTEESYGNMGDEDDDDDDDDEGEDEE